ncbi:TIGR00341 family protein [Flavobacterium cellulosilyticum]|uniref:TIGR00341 family protein n=1 Tax=Flavobacterium cellulosilyticum TaxID=2541731 RepID=A0A4R5CEW4_9FLAO|nr:TIGR00341 family protein [Flavobacterium cellulosilyticum]
MNKVTSFIDLHQGEENKKKVLENVKSNISFRGSNLWILACAIVIASVGLNMNSTAVIIGAMLISPLMGPIVGAGFGLGIFDFELLKKALKNLAIATIVGLVVSGIYFYISPFKDTQSELLSRTSPNIYDILIAFFGGLVGVVAITRVEKGNPIPGVAIATALMPPLCTAGYGLAIGNFRFFLGAMFLYTINCVFICIATFFIVKYLKYPSKKQVDEKSEKQVKYAITVLTLALMLPSIYFAYQLINQKKYIQNVDFFINNEFTSKGYALLYNKTTLNTNPKKIDLAFLSKKFTPEEIKQLNKKLNVYNIPNTQLIIKQDTTDIKKFILNEINFGKTGINKKDLQIANLENQIKLDHYDNNSILSEVRILFPEVEDISISNHTYYNNTDSSKVVPVLVYRSKEILQKTSKQKMILWLEQKLSKKNIEIYKQEEIKNKAVLNPKKRK